MTVTVHLTEHDPTWSIQYEEQAGRLRSALGRVALELEHVGSTSVPALGAKPILDVLLVVRDSRHEESYFPALEAIGFTLVHREPHWFEHRMLRHLSPSTNLHVFSSGCEEISRMKRFRDWLRSNADDRDLYDSAKRQLAAREWISVQDYADAKTQVVQQIMERAAPY